MQKVGVMPTKPTEQAAFNQVAIDVDAPPQSDEEDEKKEIIEDYDNADELREYLTQPGARCIFMARVLVIIFFVIGGVAWAVTFGAYAFANPDIAENEGVHCWARNDFKIPIEPYVPDFVSQVQTDNDGVETTVVID
jgi:hypothetical protein